MSDATTDTAGALVTAIPFSTHLGLQAAGDGAMTLTLNEPLMNHIGTMHAGALFTLGESASGVAMMRSLTAAFDGGDDRREEREHRLPQAGARPDHGEGALRERPEDLLARLGADGKVTFDVDVTLADEAGVEVATMTVTWYARKAAPAG